MGMLVFSLLGATVQATVIDVLVRLVISVADLRRDAVVIDVGPYRIPVASIDHLIAMKSGAGRSRDAIDIEELEKLKSQGAP